MKLTSKSASTIKLGGKVKSFHWKGPLKNSLVMLSILGCIKLGSLEAMVTYNKYIEQLS
jgi:hypothetical protein